MIRKVLLRRKRAVAGAKSPRPGRLRFEPLEPRWVLDVGPLLINEFMAINDSVLQDEDGDYSDWIEIYNPTAGAVDLDGWYLTDKQDNLTKWPFPAYLLGPDEYLVVFASEEDRRDPASELHTNFKLKGSGEYLALVQRDPLNPDDPIVVHEFSPEYPGQFPDVSFGPAQGVATFVSEGDELTYLVPTSAEEELGTTWTAPGFDDSTWKGYQRPRVLVTEVGTESPDYVEIENICGETVDTSGWVVAVNDAYDVEEPANINNVEGTLWHLPDSMDAAEVLYRSDQDQDTEHYWGEGIFWRTKGPGWVMIVDDQGQVADFVVWGYSPADIASLNVSINGHQVTVHGAWNGEAVPRNTDKTYRLLRSGDTDHDAASDWAFSLPASPGDENPDLALPFVSEIRIGIGFSSDPPGLNEAIQTNIEREMHDVNASLWTRIRFEVDELFTADELRLRMKYNDGFVAYLNGHKVPPRNAPESLHWNSTATATRAIAESLVYEEIDITDFVDTLQIGTNVLAIHGLNDSVTDGEFLVLPQLIAVSEQGFLRYMDSPTPGGINEVGTMAMGLEFSRPGGSFTDAFLLELTTPAPNGVIRYTLNGSLPTESSPEYAGPISISTSTQVRARVYEPGRSAGPVSGEGYIKLAPGLQSYTSDLPVMVIDTFGGGSVPSGSFEPSYMGVFETRDGWTDFTNGVDLGTRAGIKTRGSTTTHYAFEAWGELDEDKDIALLGLPRESDFILYRSPFDKSLMNGSFMYELSNQIGQYAVRTRFVDVFLNTGGGDVSSSDHIGVYVLMEKIKRGPDRVDVEKLEPEDNTEPDVTGGYVLKIDRLDPGDSGFHTSRGTPTMYGYFCYVYPKEDNLTGAQGAWIRECLEDFEDALYGPDFADPELGYARFIDVDSFIDHHILNELSKNPDMFWLSTYMYKPRNGKLHMGPIWDFDRALGFENRSVNPVGYVSFRGVQLCYNYDWWGRLFDDPEFVQRYIDRRYELRQHQMSVANMHAIIDAQAAELAQSQSGNSAWPGYVSQLKNWLTARVAWTDGLIDGRPIPTAPEFNRHGGEVDPDFDITLEAPAGIIYYTLDGTDPRLPGGHVSPAAEVFTTPLSLAKSTLVKARVYDGGKWSALNKALFYLGKPAGAGNLAITEINYHPHDPTDEELAQQPPEEDPFTAEDFEFIELRNTSDQTIDLTSVQFTDGIDFEFTFDGPGELGLGEFVVVAANRGAFEARYGTEIPVAGRYDRRLNNDGEGITLLDRFEQPIMDFVYNDAGGWPGRADGKGASLELIDPAAVPDTKPERTDFLQDDKNWRSSGEYGGSPGSTGEGLRGDVVVNELLTNTPQPMLDAIELYNTTPDEITIGGWYLSDSWGWDSNPDNGNYKKYEIPADTKIGAHGYLVFDEDDFNLSRGVHPNDFALDGAHGDDVWLMEADAEGKLIRFVDHEDFMAAKEGESLGRWPNGQGELYPMAEVTLGSANTGPRVGPLVVSELHYNPGQMEAAEDLEYVEIYNGRGQTVDLTDWRLRKGVDFDFADARLLAPYSPLVVLPFDPHDDANAAKWSAFCEEYGLHAADKAGFLGGYDGKLDNGGERVQLQHPDQPVWDPDSQTYFVPHYLEDQVIYDDKDGWPPEADGQGESLHRREAVAWGNEGGNWTSAPPTPSVVPFLPVTEVKGRYVFYNNSAFDGNDPSANDKDKHAIATDKQALQSRSAVPGRQQTSAETTDLQRTSAETTDLQTADFANYTSYSRGINGIIVDVANPLAIPHAGDFRFHVSNGDNPTAWAPAPDASSLTVTPGAGVEGSHRVTIIWPDYTIRNQWLRVTVRADRLGLDRDDVFYFGNAVGESGNSDIDAVVDETDVLLARNNPHSFFNPAGVTDRYDYNRDARVGATDILIARSNQTTEETALKLIDLTVPEGDELLTMASLEEGLRLPSAKPDTAKETSAIAEPSAHDAVLEEVAEPESARQSVPLGKWAWLCDFQQPSTRNRPSKRPSQPKPAADVLLASCWP